MLQPHGCLMDTNSEEWREKCEVDYVCRLPSKKERAGYIGLVRKHRGDDAANKLEGKVMYAWKLQKQTTP